MRQNGANFGIGTSSLLVGAPLMFLEDTAVWPLVQTRYQNKAMPDQFSNLQDIRKPAIRSKGGIVAAQSRVTAEIGKK